MMHTKRTGRIDLCFEGGFSLTELMVAVAIVSLLSVVGFGGYALMRPTRNFHADSRELVSSIQRAKIEAVTRNTCVGVVFQPGVFPAAGYTVFVDDGAGGGTACDATVNGTENAPANTVSNIQIRPDVILVASPQAPLPADVPNLFTAISFNQRSLVAARILVGNPLLLGNATNAANVTIWSRILVFPAGGAVLQTNNNPANQNNWD